MIKIDKCEYKGIGYLIYYPKDFNKDKKYPVMFHLHGSGSRGKNFEEFKGSTILSILEKEDSPLSQGICVFPQCYDDTWFSFFNDLLDLVRYVYALPYVDQSKFNISGISMGSYASYQVIQCLPGVFNKAIICCGGGMYWNSGRMKDVRFRIFHGELDNDVYPEEAKRMFDRLKEAGADVTLTLYPDCKHNCWDKTYSNYDNLKWLFE